MAWGSSYTQMDAAPEQYKEDLGSFYKLGAGERKKGYDKKVAEARARVREKLLMPKKAEKDAEIQKLEVELLNAQADLQEAKNVQNTADKAEKSLFDQELELPPPYAPEKSKPLVAGANGPYATMEAPAPQTMAQGVPLFPSDPTTGAEADRLSQQRSDQIMADRSQMPEGGTPGSTPYAGGASTSPRPLQYPGAPLEDVPDFSQWEDETPAPEAPLFRLGQTDEEKKRIAEAERRRATANGAQLFTPRFK